MALATAPISTTTAAVAAPGTSVSPGTAVPDNCHTILVTNPNGAAIFGLVGIGVPGGALVAGTSAQRIPPGTTLTLALGTRTQRGTMDQAVNAGSGLIFDANGGALTLEVTYLNSLGVV